MLKSMQLRKVVVKYFSSEAAWSFKRISNVAQLAVNRQLHS